MSCGEGALQTRGTCWFFSIINGFLLSDAGQKILFAHMEKFYNGLDAAEKAYFDDGIDAPCPLKDNIIKTKRIYFYKFLDQYLCFRSGPRSISLKAGKSAQILGGASLAGTLAKAHVGGQGAFPGEELPKILKHLGITNYLVANSAGDLPPEYAKKRPPFAICKASGRNAMSKIPKFRPKSYDLMCCSITIGNSSAPNTTAHKYHAVTGFMCEGKGYLFDSNQRKPFPCNWWNWRELEQVVYNEVARFYDFFAGGQINYLVYNYAIFNNRAYTKDIRISCKLKYKKTKTPSGIYTRVNNFEERLARGNWAYLTPAEIAAIKRARAREKNAPVLNKNFFNSLLKNAKNHKTALNTIKNLKNAGYRVNENAKTKFFAQLTEKLRPASPVNFANAKRQMSEAKYKYEKTAIYSRIYKKLSVNQRKILAHYRDKGEWLKSPSSEINTPSPRMKSASPNSPKTARRKNIEQKFANYWTQLNKNNRNTVRNFISRHQSPNDSYSKFSNINALKTAKARADFLKAKRPTLTKEEIARMKNYIKTKNNANKARRAAKKAKI